MHHPYRISRLLFLTVTSQGQPCISYSNDNDGQSVCLPADEKQDIFFAWVNLARRRSFMFSLPSPEHIDGQFVCFFPYFASNTVPGCSRPLIVRSGPFLISAPPPTPFPLCTARTTALHWIMTKSDEINNIARNKRRTTARSRRHRGCVPQRKRMFPAYISIVL